MPDIRGVYTLEARVCESIFQSHENVWVIMLHYVSYDAAIIIISSSATSKNGSSARVHLG